MASAYRSNQHWVKSMEMLFEQNDSDKDGYATLEDFETWSDNIEKEAGASPELLSKAREATHNFWATSGLKSQVRITKDQFVVQMSEFLVTEKERMNDGNDPLFFKLMDTTFDVLDTDQDGYLTMEEHATMMRVSNFDPSAAKQAFSTMDADNVGKISRQDLKVFNLTFWLIPEDETVTGMYGPKYE
jgi:Ca2+-binding EF-hand superfamily protein